MFEIRKWPPSTQKSIDNGQLGPHGGGEAPVSIRDLKVVINMHAYDRQKAILLTGPTFPTPGPVMAYDP
jgi:hypothetical protein